MNFKEEEPRQTTNNTDNLSTRNHHRASSKSSLGAGNKTVEEEGRNLNFSSVNSSRLGVPRVSVKHDSGGNRAKFNPKPNKDSDPRSIKYKLKKVFSFYTSFGDRLNLNFLKTNKFHKMMSDAKVTDSRTTKQKLDILYAATNKNKPVMDFEQFLNMLPKIALLKYRRSSHQEALLELLGANLLPLYDIIMSETDAGQEGIKIREPIDIDTIKVLFEVSSVLFEVYQYCFKYEFMIGNIETPQLGSKNSPALDALKQKSLSKLLSFCHSFDISPGILSKSTVISLWEEIILMPLGEIIHEMKAFPSHLPDIGYLFTFSRFLLFITKTGESSFFQQNSEGTPAVASNIMTKTEHLGSVLNRMDKSKGFILFQKSHGGTSSSSMTLLPSSMRARFGRRDWDSSCYSRKSRVSSAHESGSRILVPFSQSQDMSRSTYRNGANLAAAETKSRMLNKSIDSIASSSKLKSFMVNKSLAYNVHYTEELIPVFDQHAEVLHKLFVTYASMGEPTNTSRLKGIKFIKMLRDAGVLSPTNSISQPPERKGHFERVTSRASAIGTYDFKEAKMIKEEDERLLSPVDFDFIFVKLTGPMFRKEVNNRSLSYEKSVRSPKFLESSYMSKNTFGKDSAVDAKLEFETFLKAIELIAIKLYPEYDPCASVGFLIEERLLEISLPEELEDRSIGVHHIKVLVELLKNQDIVFLLTKIHKNMKTIFDFYADQKGKINITKYFQFCKDFGIFPDILSKSKIFRLFYSFSSLYLAANTMNVESGSSLSSRQGILPVEKQSLALEQSENELIDEHLFVESLALIAFEVPNQGREFDDLEKVIPLDFEEILVVF